MTDELARRIRRCMEGDPSTPLADAQFDELAQQVFAAQFDGSGSYRAFCEGRGVTPRRVAHWGDIPAVPVRAFQDGLLRSVPEEPVRIFETSGTTGAKRGRHALPEVGLELYRASLLPSFQRHLLPELPFASEGAQTSLLPVCLAPSSKTAPASSLFFMFDHALATLFREAPRRVFGPEGLDGNAWRAALGSAEREGRPVCLLGTSLALRAACDWLEARHERFYLPSGSRALHTGGTKGSSHTFTPAQLRQQLHDRVGLDLDAIVAEYGMTEACSQFYERELLEASLREGQCAWEEHGETVARRLFGPPWARAIVCDVETLRPAEPGQPGVLRLVDLANRFTLSFLQTEDLAVAGPGPAGLGSGPITLLGRATGSETRGCSLTTEEWLRRAGESRS